MVWGPSEQRSAQHGRDTPTMEGLPGGVPKEPPTQRARTFPRCVPQATAQAPRVRALAEPAPSATLHFGVLGLLLLQDPGASENGEPRSCLSSILARALDAAPSGWAVGGPSAAQAVTVRHPGHPPSRHCRLLRAQSSHSGPEDLWPQSEASAPVAHHPSPSQTLRDQQPSYDSGRPSASAGSAGHRLQGLPLCGRIKARGPGVHPVGSCPPTWGM